MKSGSKILFSAVGIGAMALIIIAVNFLAAQLPVRLDLTKEKAYTLSDGTRAILAKLDGKVTIRFYCTQSESSTPETVFLKQYARSVEDLLNEYKRAAGGKITIQKYDPQPDSDAEDSAKLDGIEGAPLADGEKYYLGVSVSQLDVKEAIPFLDPNRERQLEYDLSRAISRVMTAEKPVVGVMTSLPMFGAPPNPMEQMQQPDQQPPQPWELVKELRQDYTVRQVPLESDKIPDDIKVLLVVHPKEISEQAQYALDQFVLRGGRLAAFLDPQSVVDSHSQPNPMMGGAPPMPVGSSLDKLLAAWGLGFDKAKSVADLNLKMQLNGQDGQPTEAPTWLSLTADNLNPDDILTSQLDNIWLPGAGAFTGTPVSGLKETVLLRSTADSELVDSMQASMAGPSLLNDFKSGGQLLALGVRLTGKFPTAFPNGSPAGTNAPAGLKVSAAENTVVLVGDSDMLNDNFCLRQMSGPFGQMPVAMNANLNFAENLAEQLSGDSNLIAVRSRATLNHPFTRVKAMEAAAQEKFSAQVAELQKSLEDTQQRLDAIQQQSGDKSQKFILSAEQQAEVEKFRKEEAETRVKLKQVQKDLRREVDSLQNRVTWINIAAVPLVVTLFGIGLAGYKRKLTGAK